jgi:hypothetical protein
VDDVVENSDDADADDADDVCRGNNSKCVMPAEERATRGRVN